MNMQTCNISIMGGWRVFIALFSDVLVVFIVNIQGHHGSNFQVHVYLGNIHIYPQFVDSPAAVSVWVCADKHGSIHSPHTARIECFIYFG